MNFGLTLLIVLVAWYVLTLRYQRGHIMLLGTHLASLQLERHMETLTEGYTRAIHEDDESRQQQVLQTFAPTEEAVAAQVLALSNAMDKETVNDASMGALPFCIPYVERVLPVLTRDFRDVLRIHAAGLRHVVDNADELDAKSRAFHLSAELFLFQHSCHWFCKSRAVANARLALRHQVDHQKVLSSVSAVTRSAYLTWMK